MSKDIYDDTPSKRCEICGIPFRKEVPRHKKEVNTHGGFPITIDVCRRCR